MRRSSILGTSVQWFARALLGALAAVLLVLLPAAEAHAQQTARCSS